MSQDFSLWNGLLSFIAILVMIPIALWLYKRTHLQRKASSSQLRVVESVGLGARERVVLLEACGEQLLIGVSGQSVQLLKVVEPSGRTSQAAGQDFVAQLVRASKTEIGQP